MSRFRRLEFEAQEAQQPAGAKPTETRRVEYWLTQARGAREMGCYQAALRYYTRCLELDPKLHEGWLGQIQSLILADQLGEARTWGRKAIDVLKGGPDLLAALAQAELRLGRGSEAHGLISRAFEQPGESAYRWLVRGELFTVARLDREHSCFERAVALAKDWLLTLEVALALEYHEQYAAAHRYAVRSIQQSADAPYAWLVRGRIELALGLREDARASLERAIQLKPGYADALELLRRTNRSRFVQFLERLWREGQ